MSKRPALYMAIAFCTGIASACFIKQVLFIMLIFLIIMLICGYAAIKKIPGRISFLITILLFFCGYICLATILATNANNIVKDNYRGTANGIFNSFQYIGSFAGSITAGALWGLSDKIILIIIILVGVAGIFIILFNKSMQKRRMRYER